jgi:O-Antigen ligase
VANVKPSAQQIPNRSAGVDELSNTPGNDAIRSWCAASLLGLCLVGSIKGSPLLSWLPIDATMLFAVSCLVGWVAYAMRTGRLFVNSMRFTVLLWLTFIVPGVFLSINADLNMTKIAFLFTITLLSALLPSLVGNSLPAQRAWLGGHLVVGVILGVGIWLFPDPTSSQYYGGLDVAGGTTITTSRVLGAVAIILVTYAMSHARWRIFCLVGTALALAAMIHVGSKGPFISLALALPLVLLTARLSIRARFAGLGILVSLGIFFATTVSGSQTGGASRLLMFVSGDSADVGRSQLYDIAVRHALTTPMGMGWSGYAHLVEFQTGFFGSNVYPHNILLEIFVEGGWIAGITFIAFVIAALKRLRVESSTTYGLTFYGLGIYWLIAAQFSSDVNGNRMTWAALAFGFATVASGAHAKQRKHHLLRL